MSKFPRLKILPARILSQKKKGNKKLLNLVNFHCGWNRVNRSDTKCFSYKPHLHFNGCVNAALSEKQAQSILAASASAAAREEGGGESANDARCSRMTKD